MADKIYDREGVMSRLDNDEELFRELLVVFEEEWPKIIQVIETAIAKGDSATVALHAHSLKGALGNVGADRAAVVAKTLEFCGKDSKLAEAPALLTKLVAAVQEYRNALRVAGEPRGGGSS